MKTLKYLAICFVMCSMFAGSALAACSAGISVEIVGYFQGTTDEAAYGQLGDTIEYTVTVNVSGTQCPVEAIEPNLVLPDGTVIDLDDNLSLGSGESKTYPAAGSYTIANADIGTHSAPVGAVRASATVDGISQRESGIPQTVTSTANYDTFVINPCIEVEKTASCDVVKEGDTFDYTITITNCGGEDLTAVSIDDTMFGSLLPACETLAPGDSCTITIPYTVQPGDPDPLVNEVAVEYGVTVLPEVTVTDTSSAEVDVIHPSFEVTKTCLTDGVVADEVTFEIAVTNTGDVPLDFATDEPSIAPFSLDPNDPPSVHQVTVPVPAGATEVENTVNVVATIDGYTCGEPDLLDSATDTCTVLTADFEVTKECITPEVQVGDDATFHITITNTGDVPLELTTNEPDLWVLEPITLGAGGVFEADVNEPTMSGMLIVSNTVEVTATYEDITIVKSDSADCDVIESTEGCTPGFWKNHPNCWKCYDEETLVSEVFSVLSDPNYLYAAYKDKKCDFDADTLKKSIRYKGGPGVEGVARNLLRHASAAIQNACSQDVKYPLTLEGVIDVVNDALASEKKVTIIGAKNMLAMFNEYGCPINAQCELNGDDDGAMEP